MPDTIFMTGGTGFVGTELASRLVKMPDAKTYILVRASCEAEAYHRLRCAWFHDKELYKSIGANAVPVIGDFTKPGLGLSDKDEQLLKDNVTLVIHAGAEIGFNKSKRDLVRTNVSGTKHMIGFAKKIKALRQFVHISTAYVAGTEGGLISEDEPSGKSFSSPYEKTKADAEDLVRNSSLPFCICRPGMIIGDSKTGWARNFNTIYYVLKQMLLGRMKTMPVKEDTKLNLVPGDYVADCIIKIAFSEETAFKTFHLTCPSYAAPTAGSLTKYVRKWARKNLSISLAKTRFLQIPGLKQAGLLYNKREDERKKGYFSNLMTLMPYFFSEQQFDRKNTDEICGRFPLRWKNYIDNILYFACRKNFMRQSGQSVFEQAQIRRASKRFPVTYFDITENGIKKITGPEANERIEKTVDALWAWGIRKGDKIALTGINSVDYMVLDQALGLMGAVSVPIYYTTPAGEISMLLERSGSKWFFVGDKRIMEHIDEVRTDAKIVSFSAGQTIRHENVMRWEDFISAAAVRAERQYPDPEDLATIRYTSGTTGDPKGVMFNYSQLAWMGEVLTNLLSWKDRNDSMKYLSFLPLSHVVEGILASYAPYYVLADVEYYFLNDFGSLTDALPKVRPNVFFSVPRFYEKVWDQASSNRLAKFWLSAEDGPVKTAAGKILKAAVLRKAGIDQCRQLIVGSAPVSESLLLSYRALGIEVHNAYGQTEAPLITINRLGDNIIPSIGTVLPDTEITVEPDGELIVKGPQVALGYYGMSTDTIKDGILRTGDLGAISKDGHVILYGRKKDFIVTAYGKNISIPKVEERLKDIQGVSEAVLIGEGRPYCTALLWLENDIPDIEALISKMNEELSHPEQVRKYTIITRPLSIQAGELTPNLKVKRKNVEAHFEKEIEDMYR